MSDAYELKIIGDTMVATPPMVSARLFSSSAFTRLSEAQPQNTRPMVLVMPMIERMKAHFSGEHPVCPRMGLLVSVAWLFLKHATILSYLPSSFARSLM